VTYIVPPFCIGVVSIASQAHQQDVIGEKSR
jgi:hypothetical protein